MLPNEILEIVKSELVVRGVPEVDDAVKVELEVEDPTKEIAKAMLENDK